MNEERKIISLFREYISWIESLENMDDSLWTTPISEGKWSVSQIISHLMNWDKYFLSEILPSVRNGEGMNFPDFDPFNNLASDYAKSGVSQKELLMEAKNARKLLIKELGEMPNEMLNQHLTSNGLSNCPYTGAPYSLLYIIKESIDHDHHHKRQIMQLLNDNGLG